MPPFSAKTIANYYIAKANANAEPLSAMKLIKLVYLAHCWHLKMVKEPLISESIEAWKFGPVIPSLYRSLKKFGNGAITDTISEFSVFGPNLDGKDRTTAILNAVYDAYRKLTALQLSTLTHQEGTPWWTVWEAQGGKNRLHAVIPDSMINEFFSKKDGTAAAPRGL